MDISGVGIRIQDSIEKLIAFILGAFILLFSENCVLGVIERDREEIGLPVAFLLIGSE